MSFRLGVQPNNEYPKRFYEHGWTWPEGEYDKPPQFSGDFLSTSPILPEPMKRTLTSNFTPQDAIECADTITHLLDSAPDVATDHQTELTRLAEWLHYWGVQGAPIVGRA